MRKNLVLCLVINKTVVKHEKEIGLFDLTFKSNNYSVFKIV